LWDDKKEEDKRTVRQTSLTLSAKTGRSSRGFYEGKTGKGDNKETKGEKFIISACSEEKGTGAVLNVQECPTIEANRVNTITVCLPRANVRASGTPRIA
jgi:hypothetical protein